MSDLPVSLKRPSIWQYALCYIVWFAVVGSMIWLLVQGQYNLITPIRLSGIDYRVVSVINNTSWILIGLTTLILIVVLEYILRTGLEKGRFWSRVARSIIVEAIVLAVVYIGAPLLLKVLLAH